MYLSEEMMEDAANERENYVMAFGYTLDDVREDERGEYITSNDRRIYLPTHLNKFNNA